MVGISTRILVGCSGWSYGDWAGRFYPKDLGRAQWFNYYSRHFDTVELNNTFYHLPRATTIQRWANQARQGFVYAVKAHRSITHMRRLRSVGQLVEQFCRIIQGLGPHLGPVLYQLPPGLHKDLGLLESFLAAVPEGQEAVVEFRHSSWYGDEVLGLLERRQVALCIHDMAGSASPRIHTAGPVYLRFHGPVGRYRGSYSDSILREWAEWVLDQVSSAKVVYAYFNNDVEGHAVKNARTFKAMLSRP